MNTADTVKTLRRFLRDSFVCRGRITPRGELGEPQVFADQRADDLVEAGCLRLVDTMPSGTRWFRVTTRGRNLALVGVAA